VLASVAMTPIAVHRQPKAHLRPLGRGLSGIGSNFVNQEAGLAIDRIVEATPFGPLQAPARRAPRRRS
jgi:hypothetical protein